MKFSKMTKGEGKKISLILVVDDSGEIYELFSTCRRGEGCPVLDEATGRQGLQLAVQPEQNFVWKGLQIFARDQRQVLNICKNDVTARIREHLDEKYPHQDMSIVVESFDIKLVRDISRRETVAQNQSHDVKV